MTLFNKRKAYLKQDKTKTIIKGKQYSTNKRKAYLRQRQKRSLFKVKSRT